MLTQIETVPATVGKWDSVTLGVLLLFGRSRQLYRGIENQSLVKF